MTAVLDATHHRAEPATVVVFKARVGRHGMATSALRRTFSDPWMLGRVAPQPHLHPRRGPDHGRRVTLAWFNTASLLLEFDAARLRQDRRRNAALDMPGRSK